MKVALVYDRVNKWGGAERVLLALKKLFPEATLYTSVYRKEKATWADNFLVKTSFLQGIPLASKNHELLAGSMPIVFESYTFDSYDLVISVTSEAAKGIITKPQTKHICYCLTPTRYLWSGYDYYFANSLFRFLASPVVFYLRKWDKIASTRPDVMIAISQEVKQRIKKYYNRDVDIIYPPLTLKKTQTKIKSLPSASPFYLIVSRLVSYKRIDIAIKACNKLGVTLKIIGTGSEENYLRSLAGPTIEFIGNVDDKTLNAYYYSSSGLLFPGNEDFGLVMVEAQQAGKPVLAYKAGGACEIVKDGVTGMFFLEQNEHALSVALDKFRKIRYNESDCIKQAERFNENTFQKQFLAKVHSILTI